MDRQSAYTSDQPPGRRRIKVRKSKWMGLCLNLQENNWPLGLLPMSKERSL